MIRIVKASVLRTETEHSLFGYVSRQECAQFFETYIGQDVRLWRYHASLSRLSFTIRSRASLSFPFVDFFFVGTKSIKANVHWTLGAVSLVEDNDWGTLIFSDPEARFQVEASDLFVVIQDEQEMFSIDFENG
jgi:hypothetical protein